MKGKWFTKIKYLEFVNVLTGELTRLECLSKKKAEFDFYIKMYIADDQALVSLTSTEFVILIKLCKKLLKYGEYKISVSKGIIKEIAKEKEIAPKSVNNAIDQLCEKRFLLTVDYDLYYINPAYLFYGGEDVREKALKEIRNFYLDKAAKAVEQ